jgi:hypothetical protein
VAFLVTHHCCRPIGWFQLKTLTAPSRRSSWEFPPPQYARLWEAERSVDPSDVPTKMVLVGAWSGVFALDTDKMSPPELIPVVHASVLYLLGVPICLFVKSCIVDAGSTNA